LDGPAVLRRWRPSLIVRDRSGSPVFGLPYGVWSPLVAVPPDEPVTLELLWTVPGFGKVLLAAVDQGRGFRVPKNGTITLQLTPELAGSRVFELRSWVDQRNGGVFASVDAAADMQSADERIAAMAAEGDERRRAAIALDALRLAMKAGESEVLAEARES